MTEAAPRRARHLGNLATTSPRYVGSKSFILFITSDTSAILSRMIEYLKFAVLVSANAEWAAVKSAFPAPSVKRYLTVNTSSTTPVRSASSSSTDGRSRQQLVSF